MNNLKVFLLMSALIALSGVVEGAIGGKSAMVVAEVMNFVMYSKSDDMFLKAYPTRFGMYSGGRGERCSALGPLCLRWLHRSGP